MTWGIKRNVKLEIQGNSYTPVKGPQIKKARIRNVGLVVEHLELLFIAIGKHQSVQTVKSHLMRKSRTGNANIGWYESTQMRGIDWKGAGRNFLRWWRVYFGYTVWLYLSKIISVYDGHESEQALGVGDGQEAGVLQSMGSQRVGHDWATELNN